MSSTQSDEPNKQPAAGQHTGNHDRPPREREGNEKHGGTRAGAENVEPRK